MKKHSEKNKTEQALTFEDAMFDFAQDVQVKRCDFDVAKQSYDIARLRKCMDAFLRKENFKQGQIVVWKENMRNRKKPEYGQPVIVVDVLKEPLKDLSSPGSAYFNEPLDLVIGFFDEYGDWIVLHVDARCFELFKE